MMIYDNSCNVAELDPCSEIRPSPSSPSLRLQSFLELLPHGYPKYVLDRPSWILTEGSAGRNLYSKKGDCE